MRVVSLGSLALGIFLLVLAVLNAAPIKEELQVSLSLAIASLVFLAIAIITAGISLISYFRSSKKRRR